MLLPNVGCSISGCFQARYLKAADLSYMKDYIGILPKNRQTESKEEERLENQELIGPKDSLKSNSLGQGL